MTNMFSNANKVPMKFTRVRREVRFVKLVVDGLPPIEAEKRADAWCGSSEELERDCLDGDTV